MARTPDAPEGVKGISLFLVPKILVNDNGSLGESNGVSCGSIEHKKGIKASATCVMNFDDARGFIVGDLNKGMRAMFKMMNTERVAVGMQGLGVSEAAYQGAVEYARERIQGRALAIWLGMLLDISSRETYDNKRIDATQQLLKRQVEMMQEAFTQVANSVKDISTTASSSEIQKAQSKLIEEAMQKTLSNAKELSEIVSKSQLEASRVINERFEESMKELKNNLRI